MSKNLILNASETLILTNSRLLLKLIFSQGLGFQLLLSASNYPRLGSIKEKRHATGHAPDVSLVHIAILVI